MDLREFQKIKHFVETLRLGQYDPWLQEQLDKIRPEANNPIDDLVWPHIKAHFDALAGDYETTGLINVPPAFLPAGFPVALQDETNETLNVSKDGNTVFTGPPGCGKTTLKHNTMLACIFLWIKLFIMDAKKDDVFFLALKPSFVQIDEQCSFNLLSRPDWRSVDEHITEQVEWFRRCFYSGEQQGAVLRKALTMAFAAKHNPSWKDVHEIVDKLAVPKDTYSWRDACLGISERLHKIKQRYRIPYETNDGISLAVLLNGDIYLGIESLDPVGGWAGSMLLNHIFQRNKAAGTRTITTAAFIDEGINVLSKAHAASSISGTNPLATLSTMNREFGLWLCFTTVDLNETDPLILSTAATIAVLPGVHERALRLAGLSPLQAQTARHMRRGQVMFVYPGRLPWPVMARFNPLPEGLKERRPVVRENRTTAPEPPEPAHAAPQPLIDQPPAPAAPPEPSPIGIGLNESELSLMRAIHSRAGIDTTTRIYEIGDLHYSVGDAANQKLQKLGLVTATKIASTSGRGGSASKALQLTAEGYARLGLKPPRRTRGGGPQSEYLCQRLHELIMDGHLEMDLAGKAPDLLLRYDPDRHQRLHDALSQHGLHFGLYDTLLSDGLRPGDFIAIEVEAATDESNLKKSIHNNLTKDLDAGVRLVVFAVMPKMLPWVRKVFKYNTPALETMLIIDSLKLLDYLRKSHGEKEEYHD